MLRRDLLVSGLIFGAAAALQGQAFAQTMTEEIRVTRRGYPLLMRVRRGLDPQKPTIVLEAGGGFDSTQWSEIQPRLGAASGTTIVSYDRPGFGGSDLPDKPYDIADELEAFHEALQGLGLANSVILVGHSYGGLLVQLYANRWSSTVKGIVLLDPNSPAAMLAMGAEGRSKAIENPQTPRQRANARIDAGFERALETVYAAPFPVEVPLIVVSAETPPFAASRLARVFKLSHELLVASVNDGKSVLAERSNHLIPAQRPDLVISSVLELLRKTA